MLRERSSQVARGVNPAPARPRILHLVTLSDWGGAQACVYALARGLRGVYDPTVGCAPGGPLVTRLRRAGVRVVELPVLTRTPHLLADPAALVLLARWLRRERFALVHCHSTKAGLLGRLAARAAGVPAIVFTAHAWPFLEGWSPLIRAGTTLVERGLARISGAIICVAEHVRREALSLGIGRPAQLHVVYNGVDPQVWLAEQNGGGGIREDRCTVVAVGRLKSPKDQATLIEAWRRLSGPHRLFLAGDGPLRRTLEDLVQRRGLTGRVEFLGRRDDVPALLRHADIFVLSSLREGLPLVVLEAMMSALPVVASNVGGIGEAVVHDRTGLLVPPRDPAALAAALRRLLEDAALRRRLGAAGRDRALGHFTSEHMLTKTAALYDRVLSGAAAGG